MDIATRVALAVERVLRVFEITFKTIMSML